MRATTVLLVRRDGRVAMASDGQVTLGNAVMKSGAAKVKRAGKGGRVLVGFAGGAADGLALFTRFETKLEEFNQNLERAVVELAKDWRTDRVLRQLEAVMIVADADKSFLVSGTGDLLQPDDGRPAGDRLRRQLRARRGAALSCATRRSPRREIAREAMRIAAELCIYTNDRLTLEEL